MATSLKRLMEIIDDGSTFTEDLRDQVEQRLSRERETYTGNGKSRKEREAIIRELCRLLKVDAERKRK